MASSLTNDALGAEVGHCDTPLRITALLKAEGQRSLAHGNQKIAAEQLPNGELRAVSRYLGLIFTADVNGRVGYILQADHPIGTPTDKICVADRMHDVRLFDARRGGVPEAAKVPSTAQAAASRCDALAKRELIARGSCGFHNEALGYASLAGTRVMMQGRGVSKRADGSYQPDGTLITITLTPPGEGRDEHGNRAAQKDGIGAILDTVTPEGAIMLGRAFSSGAYTQAAIELLEGGQRSGRLVSALTHR